MTLNELPIYPTNHGYESRVYNKYNQLVAVCVDIDHFRTACLICHLLNQAFGVEPNVYYPVPEDQETAKDAPMLPGLEL